MRRPEALRELPERDRVTQCDFVGRPAKEELGQARRPHRPSYRRPEASDVLTAAAWYWYWYW